MVDTPLLDAIDDPTDLRRLSPRERELPLPEIHRQQEHEQAAQQPDVFLGYVLGDPRGAEYLLSGEQFDQSWPHPQKECEAEDNARVALPR